MNRNFSIYLDFCRFCAAIIVLLSHFAYERYTGGAYIFIREINLGSDAVVFFFVLSGLVISYSAENKDKNLKTYSWNRITRIYSIIIPTIILTIICDKIGTSINPEAYEGFWYNSVSILHHFVSGLTFTNEWWLGVVRLGSNGPYWSLSYEVLYYALFGIFLYLHGFNRYILLFFLVLFSGIAILILLPIWVMGVFVYNFIKSRELNNSWALILTFIPVIIYPLFIYIGLPVTLLEYSKIIFGEFFINNVLRFSNEFIWNYIVAILISMHLIGVSFVFKSLRDINKGLFYKAVRYLAGASFSIYIVHYPVLQLFHALLGDSFDKYQRDVILLVSTFAVCMVFASIFERNLSKIRNFFKKTNNY